MGNAEIVKKALRAAIIEGQRTWSVERLANKDPRFRQAWLFADAVPGWFLELCAAAMFHAMAQSSPRRVVEIGSYLGKSTVFFAKAMDVLGLDGEVVAIDPHTGDRYHKEKLGVEGPLNSLEMFREHLRVTNTADRVRSIVASSADAAAEWSDPIGFLFVDGWHSYDAVVADGRDWIPYLDPDGVAIFDDTRNYVEVDRAVRDLDKDGVLSIWGEACGQTWCGPPDTVVPSFVTFILKNDRPFTRHFIRQT